MNVMEASQVTTYQLEQFLQHNHDIDLATLLENGFVVECSDKIIGCFSLEPIGEDSFWLKQLYVIQQEAVKLPRIVEMVLIIAEQKQAKVIYAHSEQPVTDLLLASLSFSLQSEETAAIAIDKDKGHWWTYSICS